MTEPWWTRPIKPWKTLGKESMDNGRTKGAKKQKDERARLKAVLSSKSLIPNRLPAGIPARTGVSISSRPL
jgi:hypothetical protein